MKRRAVTILFFVLCYLRASSQDPQFSQFYSNYLYLAPSFAGLAEKNRVAFNYRNQWPEIKYGYETYSVSFDMFIDKFNSGVGILAYQDVAGSGRLRTTSIGLQYSFDFKVTQNLHARPGLHFNYTERGIDFSKLLWNDQIFAGGNLEETKELPPMQRIGDIDFSTSVLVYTDRVWFGAAVDHLLKPNQSMYFYDDEAGNPAKVPLKYSVFGGVKFIRPEHLLRPVPTTVQLAFLYKQQDRFRQLDFGVYWYRNPFVAGIWYRGIPFYKEVFNRDAITLLIGIKTRNMNIGYSYDLTVSKLITNTGGAHEISVSYSFKVKPIKHKPKAIPCPEF
jgi:type IX secretion system PorP/SprF family membrane protein